MLTQAISPRDRVRVASTDAAGVVLNQYAASRPVTGPQPTAPWAVPLADAAGYRLIAFDLDAKHGTAAADADSLSRLLTEHAIEHLVCASGSFGGRHVWVALTETVDPQLVATLARLVAGSHPSLDTAPLCNPATGCVRPPGTPHRNGGTSIVLTGSTSTLTRPTTTPDQLRQLVEDLAATINGGPTPPLSPDAAGADDVTGSIRIDTTGNPYLPGRHGELPAGSLAALQHPVGDADASTVLWRVLLGAASSHWHLTDIAALAPTAPGLEHLRSRRSATGKRSPRSRYDTAATLVRQWRYAVTYAAAHPRDTGTDATFDSRAGRITDTVRALQTRADTAPGRWQRGGGPADRRVLDTLHTLALTAVTAVIEADTRRIALTAGIGRETARVALHRLTTDGWIRQTRQAAGVHGATWTIDPTGILHNPDNTARSQAATRPAGAGAAERTLLTRELEQRTALARHDTFSCNHALPHSAGNRYARLSPTRPTPATDAADLDDLERLRQHGLAHHSPDGWTRAPSSLRDRIATRLGIAGRLETRKHRYLAERDVWSWWQAEHDWMRTPRTQRDRRSPATQVPLWQTPGHSRYPRHPRRPDGRADYAAARTAHLHGALHAPALAA